MIIDPGAVRLALRRCCKDEPNLNHERAGDRFGGYSVFCPGCGRILPGFDTAGEAVAAWNRSVEQKRRIERGTGMTLQCAVEVLRAVEQEYARELMGLHPNDLQCRLLLRKHEGLKVARAALETTE